MIASETSPREPAACSSQILCTNLSLNPFDSCQLLYPFISVYHLGFFSCLSFPSIIITNFAHKINFKKKAAIRVTNSRQICSMAFQKSSFYSAIEPWSGL